MDNKNIVYIAYDATPSEKNIAYAFQRLITPLSVATEFIPYKTSWKEIESILKIIKNWAIIYDETSDLRNINIDEVNEIENRLYDLDGKYLSVESIYVEEAYIWLEQLQVLIKKFIEVNGGK